MKFLQALASLLVLVGILRALNDYGPWLIWSYPELALKLYPYVPVIGTLKAWRHALFAYVTPLALVGWAIGVVVWLIVKRPRRRAERPLTL